MPLLAPFDACLEQTKRVSPSCLVAFERHRYSVPSSFANRPVSLRVYAERLLIVAEGNVIAEHERLIARGHDRRSLTVRSADAAAASPRTTRAPDIRSAMVLIGRELRRASRAD